MTSRARLGSVVAVLVSSIELPAMLDALKVLRTVRTSSESSA